MPKSQHVVVTPEERELEKKRAEFVTLEGELAERELELATLQNELRAFEGRYFRTVGTLYAELDDLEAQIAEAEARHRPEEQSFQQRATEARAKAAASAQAISTIVPTPQDRFTPGDELKALYREVARRIHPDLAADDRERARRHRPMAEATAAYAAGDAARLRAILDDWHSSPDSVAGEGIGAELVRIIRKIHQVERRLTELRATTTKLRETPMHGLFNDVSAAAAHGRDLLAEMVEQLRREIATATARLSDLASSSRAVV